MKCSTSLHKDKQRACAKEEDRKFNATEKEDGDRQKKSNQEARNGERRLRPRSSGCYAFAVPKVVLAGVASFLIQKETQERTTVRMHGM